MQYEALYFDRISKISIPVSVCTWLFQLLTFLFAGTIFQLLDHFKLCRSFKTQSNDSVNFWRCFLTAMKNQVFILLPAMIFAENYGLAFFPRRKFHSPFYFWISDEMLDQMVLFLLIGFWMALGHDILFYIGHRFILHSTWGFHYFRHSIHHSTKASCGISAMFMSPEDFLIEIVVPYLFPLFLASSWMDLRLHSVILSLGTIGGIYEHSGYNFFPFFESFSTMAHFMHHSRYNCSFSDGFGSPCMMDSLLKTSYQHKSNSWGERVRKYIE